MLAIIKERLAPNIELEARPGRGKEGRAYSCPWWADKTAYALAYMQGKRPPTEGPYFLSFRTRSISVSASLIAKARLTRVVPDLLLPLSNLTSHRQPVSSVN